MIPFASNMFREPAPTPVFPGSRGRPPVYAVQHRPLGNWSFGSLFRQPSPVYYSQLPPITVSNVTAADFLIRIGMITVVALSILLLAAVI